MLYFKLYWVYLCYLDDILNFFSVTQNNCQEAANLSSESLLFLHVSNYIVFPSHHLFFLTLQCYCILKNVLVNTFCMMLYDTKGHFQPNV